VTKNVESEGIREGLVTNVRSCSFILLACLRNVAKIVRLIGPVRVSRKIRPEKEISDKALFLFNYVFQPHSL
jgi:hypothetical protein